MKKMILILGMMLSQAAFATGREVTVNMQGLFCAFCGQGIVKNLSKEPAVAKVDVSMDVKPQTVHIVLKEGQNLSDEEIKKIITESGFKVIGVETKK